MSVSTEHVISLLHFLLPSEERLPVPKVDFRIGIVVDLGETPSASLSDAVTPGVFCSPKKPLNKEILCDMKLLHYK